MDIIREARSSSTPIAQYHFLLRESVGAGHVPAIDDDHRILAAVHDAGAEGLVYGLPDGLDTQLGSEFPGGRNLSTGQWQKLALARARMRPAPLLQILDEPAASLDPAAEYELFNRFQSLMEACRRQGGIVILVSRRLETVRMADSIVVMSSGRVVEAGTHDDLLRADGLYAELHRLKTSNL